MKQSLPDGHLGQILSNRKCRKLLEEKQLAFALSLYSEAYKPQQPTDSWFLQPRLLWETTMMFINK